jgi:hypothetical protein
VGLFDMMYRDAIRTAIRAGERRRAQRQQERELRKVRARDDERSGRKAEFSLRAYERKGVITPDDPPEVRIRKILTWRGYPPDEIEQKITEWKRTLRRLGRTP